MQPTILTYMATQDKMQDKAVVVEISEAEGRSCVILDQTIFYPQGGGQAWDTGTMRAENGATFAVEEVRFIDGFVHHYGVFSGGTFVVGDSVACEIDVARRLLNSRLHSAGHLLDEAVKNLGYAWTPTKGIHFPGKMAVEYAGVLDDAESARIKIEVEVNRLIKEGRAIRSTLVNVADLATLADYVPPNLPENKPVRIVNMGGAKSTPCGGTHVATTADIGAMVIRYVKAKKGDIKVSYDVEETRKIDSLLKGIEPENLHAEYGL